MEEKKRVAILVAIALILAITAIVLSLSDSEVPISGNAVAGPSGSAQIGIMIEPAAVEDKMANEANGAQS